MPKRHGLLFFKKKGFLKPLMNKEQRNPKKTRFRSGLKYTYSTYICDYKTSVKNTN